MRTEKGKIIKKLLISFILIMGFIFAISLYDSQALAITYFPGSTEKQTVKDPPSELKTGTQYKFNRQVLWRNPYIFCIEPQVALLDKSTGTIKAKKYIDSKAGETNLNGDTEYLLAAIYATMGNSNANKNYADYEAYLKECKWQHVIWIAKYADIKISGENVKLTPKAGYRGTMEVDGKKVYSSYIITWRLPWVDRAKEFTDKDGNVEKVVHKAWHYYDNTNNNNGKDGGEQTKLKSDVLGALKNVCQKKNIVKDIKDNIENKNIQINDSKAKVYYNNYTGKDLEAYKEDFIIVGPFEITGTRKSADEIKQIDIEYSKNGETVKKSGLSTNNDIKFIFKSTAGKWNESYSGSMANISGTFYIIVNKKAGIGNIDNVTIHFNRTEIEAKWWEIDMGKMSQHVEYGWGRFINEPKSISVKVPNLIPPVQVELDKVDTAGTAVDGAEFKIVYSNGLPEGMAGSNGKGEVTFPEIQPTSPDSFTATITEINAPSGYKKLEESIKLRFTYKNGKWEVIQEQKGDVNGDEKIDIKDAELVQKYAQEILSDTESKNFNKDNADMDNDGRITLSDARIILQIAEGKITAEKTIKEIKEENNVVTITVPNKSIIEKLTLLKTSSVSGGKVEGAKFKLTLTNVASIKNHQIPEAGEVTIIETTNSDGNLVLEDIEIKNLNEPVVITIEEIEAPVGYKKIEGTITVTLKREGNGYNISETKKDSTVTDDEFKAGKVTLKNHELELNIKDIPVMNLGGIVWTEKIQTDKATAEINNQYDGENQDEALAGIKVTLYKDGKKVAETTSSDGNQKATYTDHKGNKVEVDLAKGEYMFTDITAGDDYYVVFEYDGIKYQAMTNSKEQAYTTKARDTKIAEEPNRKDFNANTKEISGTGEVDKSKTNTGWIIEYDLDNNSTPNKAIYKDVKNKNGELQYVEGKTYTYLSKTEDWMGTWNTDGTINKSHYAFNINCGLNKKLFDLSLGTDVKDATVTINGNQTTYTYDQILDGKLDEALNRPSSKKKIGDNKIEYNLYLAVSDYNYRIADYKVPGNGAIENKYDEEALNEGQIESAKKDSELEVYVTYRIELKNQSTQHDAKVNLVEYHYDYKYAFLDENNKNIKLAEGTNLENRVLMIDTSDLQINGGETKSLDLTFKVLPGENGNKCVIGEDYLNQAEIVSYTTGGGLVDEDSAPGNAFLEENKVRYEDDTDEANGIQIKLKTNAERSISGKVFDTENNNSVNDVIVQLIELVEIENKQQYEYIWQETVAGSNTVKTTDRNGYSGKSYSFTGDDENKAGEYKFTQGIIPGNYIVRFIYGDGRTYTMTENTLKYNGEDYKSTYVDYDYNAKWYNDTKIGEKYLYEINDDISNTDNISNAVDNEARRLKVMSYAVDVDGTKGAELALLSKPIETDKEKLKDVLDNTWMCAETLKIKMPVDTDSKENVRNDSTVTDGNNPNTSNTQFNRVNLGLMERPKTKLVLEKYITGLTVRPVASGVNLIANATADINKIIDKKAGDAIELEGQKDGLFATKSGRKNRGLWYLQTDTTELAQGADAFITYTYVIRNDGEQDYLNERLIDEFYNPVKIDEYANKLSYLEAQVKNDKKQVKETPYKNGTYISNFYYTGEKGENDKEVQASVEQIQEALNPKVKFVNSTTDFSKTDRNPNIKYAYYDTNGNIQTNDSSINEIITSTTGTEKMQLKGVDTSKKLVVSVGLSASEIENGGVYDSYIAQVTHYTNAAGRRDQSTPDNLSYVHSYDAGKTLEGNNEEDEFWAERFTITKPTGEDKITPVQIAIITISAVAVLGVGIILIKKFVLKK